MESSSRGEKESFSDRYERINRANELSFYMTDADRPFSVYLSVHSVGPSREEKLGRTILAGNMSTLNQYGPGSLTPEERIEDAEANMSSFFASLNIENSPHLLFPSRDYSIPLTATSVEEDQGDVRVRSDFLYSYNPEDVMTVRPADCPVVIASAETPAGTLNMLIHYPWEGAANGYIQQTARIFDDFGIDRNEIKVYIAPGAHAENYPYTNYPQDPRERFPQVKDLFVDTREENGAYAFSIDTPYHVYQGFIDMGIPATHIFADTSDTAALSSGYSSHGRSRRLDIDNSRDMVVADFRIKT